MSWIDEEVMSSFLSKKHLEIFLPCLKKISNTSLSIFLSGSWSREENTDDSDIDFDIIVSDISQREKTHRILRENLLNNCYEVGNHDIKIHLLRDIINSRPNRHFYLWTRLNNAILLFGTNLSPDLDAHKTKIFFHNQVEQIRNGIDYLKSKMMYVAACFFLYYGLVSFYFGERYILNNGIHDMTKDRLLFKFFGSFNGFIRANYLRITKRLETTDLNKLSLRMEKRISPSRYDYLQQVGESVLSYVRQIHHRILVTLDNME